MQEHRGANVKTLPLALFLLAALALTAAAAAPPQADEVLTGTILKLMPKMGDLSQFMLRVDKVEASALRLGRGDTVRVKYSPDQVAPVPGLGASASLGRGELVKLYARRGGDRYVLQLVPGDSSLLRLGRGEVVTPAAYADQDLGNRRARLLVKAFLPIHVPCHAETLKLLGEVARAEKARLRIQIIDMRTKEGQAEMRQEGLTCATVLVNNRMSFDLPSGESVRSVILSHRPNEPDSTYHSEDVRAVIQQELARLYPPPPPKPSGS
jgi:hypothetical protein